MKESMEAIGASDLAYCENLLSKLTKEERENFNACMHTVGML